MPDHDRTTLSDGPPRNFYVCAVCHRWYQAEGTPWWQDDRCGGCYEARRTRTEARAHPPARALATDEDVAEDEVPAEA